MKTASMEVVCDGCGQAIKMFDAEGNQNKAPLYLTLKGISIGHKKGDFCDARCLAAWAGEFYDSSQE